MGCAVKSSAPGTGLSAERNLPLKAVYNLSLIHILLKQHPQWLKCSAQFIFQYAEELPPGGAKPMIDDGCLEGVSKIYGLHVSEEIPTGSVGVRCGKYMAASDAFFIDFTGEGGHGSRPLSLIHI